MIQPRKKCEEQTPRNAAAESPALQEDHACDACGVFGAYELGDRHLCGDCYQQAGACCG